MPLKPESSPLDTASVESLLEAASSPDQPLAAGSTAALSVALAAALVESCAETMPERDAAGGLVAQAQVLKARSLALVETNRSAYGTARTALVGPSEGDYRLGQALQETLDTLNRIGGRAADTAELAAQVAGMCESSVLPDAVSAALLAASAARIASVLIEANLLSLPGHPARLAAEADLKAATSSRDAAVALFAT